MVKHIVMWRMAEREDKEQRAKDIKENLEALKGKIDIEVSEDVLDDTQDLIDTLNALGYKNAEIKKVIGQIDKSISLEEQVKEALKLLLK